MTVTFGADPATMERPMPVEPASDADLVERSLRRDPGAFGSLVERHQRLVFGVALARCGDPALAEDVAQDAFVTAWRDLDRLHDADRVGSWVAGIARNLASNAARGRARRRAEAQVPEPVPVPTPEDEALGREDREFLQRALAEVPVAHREALVLYYLEGESIAHIAASLGVREDLVKQRLSRGRRALRETAARRVEAALARVRPGRGFGAGVVAMVTALAARKAVAAGATGKAIFLMSGTHKLGLVLVALVVAAGATWLVTRARDGHTSVAAPATPQARSAATQDPSPEPPRSNVRRLQSPAERTALVEQIRAARKARAAAPPHAPPAQPTAATPAPALPESTIDKAYIRRSVRALLPLLQDCYEQGLQRDPTLGGTVVVDFTIEGEPVVGGVIGHSAIDAAASSLSDVTTRECIQETMYALEIDPPADGGVVTVKYPFAFSYDGPPP